MSNTTIINPIVSVVMITYKHEAFIAEAIEGVLMQEVDFPVELIIADDCSPDGTSEIVQGFIDKHSKGNWIKYTRHVNNKGMMPNFIWALEQCKGKYIALCEGDDYWTDPYKLQKQVDFLEGNPEYHLIHTNYELLKNDTGEIKPKMNTSIGFKNTENLDFKFYFCNTRFIRTLTVCFRKSPAIDLINTIQNDFESTIYAGDSLLHIVLAHHGKVKYFDGSMAVYRQLSESASHSADPNKIFKLKKNQLDLRIFLLDKFNLNLDEFKEFFEVQIYALLDFCSKNNLYDNYSKVYNIFSKLNIKPKMKYFVMLYWHRIKKHSTFK
jgi:glycosyltransferase involved in cell wall biosynthesis